MLTKMTQRAAVAVILTLCLFAQKPRNIKPYGGGDKNQDIEYGRQASVEIAKQVQVVNDPTSQRVIDRIVRSMASQPEAGGFPYSIKLVNDPSINAFALPGGPMFVHTGLVKAAENEDQLAGVLAHEISHVALRHGMQQASKARMWDLIGLAGGIFGGIKGGALGSAIQLGTGLTSQLVVLKYSRDHERDADVYGARLMNAAGYNPIEMARFFEKLEADGGQRAPEFFASHPDPGNRVKLVENEIPLLPRATYDAARPAEFQRAKAFATKIPPPPKRRPGQGQPSGGEPPPVSGPVPSISAPANMRVYQGASFAIAYPQNWQVVESNGDAATIAAPRGFQRTQNGVNVGAGALTNSFASQNMSLDQATEALVQQFLQNDQRMRVVSQPQRVTIDGRPGLFTELETDSQLVRGRESDILVTVESRGRINYVVFVTPQAERARAEPSIKSMLGSMRLAQ